VNVKLPGLDTITEDDLKKMIDIVVAAPAVTSEVESRTVKIGINSNEVKKSLGNPTTSWIWERNSLHLQGCESHLLRREDV
jgi:hypothetical protein